MVALDEKITFAIINELNCYHLIIKHHLNSCYIPEFLRFAAMTMTMLVTSKLMVAYFAVGMCIFIRFTYSFHRYDDKRMSIRIFDVR